jgi:hypothetical protein
MSKSLLLEALEHKFFSLGTAHELDYEHSCGECGVVAWSCTAGSFNPSIMGA